MQGQPCLHGEVTSKTFCMLFRCNGSCWMTVYHSMQRQYTMCWCVCCRNDVDSLQLQLTCVLSPRLRASSQGCSMPFWMKTRSAMQYVTSEHSTGMRLLTVCRAHVAFACRLCIHMLQMQRCTGKDVCRLNTAYACIPSRRSSGVESRTPCRSLFLVHTTMGPGGPSTA